MKFLLDQNLSPKTTNFLRDLGHDAVDTRELNLSEASDDEIWQVAVRYNRILITFDLGFADLRKHPVDLGPGLIILRTKSTTSDTVNSLLKKLTEIYSSSEISGNLVIITDKKIRIRKF